MMDTPQFPNELKASLDQAMSDFLQGKSNLEILKPIYEWLEIDGWDALISDLGEQMVLNLGYLSEYKFSDTELKDWMGIPDDQILTDSDRLGWGRDLINRALKSDDDTLLASIHTYAVTASDGTTGVIGCIVEIQGQAGPSCDWQGLWKTRNDFLAAVSDGKYCWVTPFMGEVPDDVILALWQKPKFLRKRSKTNSKTKSTKSI